ncbi:MAG: CapA family protein [Oscillospiraceae bacterium]|nr:CapA family protein [Oscillospiraceae bacterium]
MEVNKAGVLWGGGYNSEYLKYEKEYPFAFPWTRDTSEDEPRYVKGPDGYWYRPDANESGKAVLSCTGDLMCEPRQHRAYKFGSHYYFHPMFRYIRGILRDSDFAVGNLETTLTDCTPYAGEWHVIEGKYHCNAPECYLDAIRYAGFDALVNANNHNCDSGVTGLMDTLDALDRHSFMHTGTFRPDEKERAIYVKINGIRVAILSYATYFNKLETNFTELGRKTLLNTFSADKAQADIKAARDKGAEFVLTYIHWGKEYTHETTEWQQRWAKQLADAGADYIVGSHSHCLQPRGTVTAADGREVPVVYSLGNFVTNESKLICKRTGILQLVLAKEDGKVRLRGEYFIPCHVFNQIETSSYAVTPADSLLNTGLSNTTLDQSKEYIEDVMKDIPMMTTASMTISELCRVLGAEMPAGVKDRRLSRLCTKPDNVTAGSAYFAIIWAGTSEIADVYKRGAAVVVTTREIEGVPCIVVPDVDEAYCQAFSHIKSRFGAKTVVITGTAGKTTTKELLECVMRDNFITLSSEGNWNTRHTGMLIMQRLRSYHECYVQEVHEGDPNSAEMMSRALMPDCAVITNIDAAHRENFSSDEEFSKCFTDITIGLREGGVLFVNGDDQRLMEAVRRIENKHFRVVTFGVESRELDYRAENIRLDKESIRFDVVYGGRRASVYMPSPVQMNAYNATVAFAIGVEFGIPAERILKSISKYVSNGMRQNYMEYKGLHMMLDCRSAAPKSMWSSVEALCRMPTGWGGRRVAVLGEMHLSDEETEAEHRKVGRQVAQSDIDYLYCYGDKARYIYEEAVKCGFDKNKAMYCETKRELELELCQLLRPGDALLIKGGRRMYLNSTIRKLFGITISVD